MKGGKRMAKYQELADAVIKGDNVKSKEIAQKLVDGGAAPVEILSVSRHGCSWKKV